VPEDFRSEAVHGSVGSAPLGEARRARATNSSDLRAAARDARQEEIAQTLVIVIHMNYRYQPFSEVSPLRFGLYESTEDDAPNK
jgi:hypothetical protein